MRAHLRLSHSLETIRVRIGSPRVGVGQQLADEVDNSQPFVGWLLCRMPQRPQGLDAELAPIALMKATHAVGGWMNLLVLAVVRGDRVAICRTSGGGAASQPSGRWMGRIGPNPTRRSSTPDLDRALSRLVVGRQAHGRWSLASQLRHHEPCCDSANHPRITENSADGGP